MGQDTYNVGLKSPTFGGGARQSCRTSDGGFVQTVPGSPAGWCIFKTDSIGNVMWLKNYTHPHLENVMELTETSDSCIVVLSIIYDSIGTGLNAIKKFDPAGTVLWSKYINSFISTNYGLALCPSENGGFAIAGGGCNGNNFVMRFNTYGNFIWSYQYPNQNATTGFPTCMLRKSTGNFVIAGYDIINGVKQINLFEIDTNAVLQWYKNIDDSLASWAWSIAESPFQEITISGYVQCANSPSDPSYLLKVDSSGNFLWMNRYYNSQPFCIESHTSLSSGSFVAVGEVSTATSWNDEYFVMSIDFNGLATSSYSSGSSQFNHAGGDFLYDVYPAPGDASFGIGESADGSIIQRFDPWLSGFCDPYPVTISTVPYSPAVTAPPVIRYSFPQTVLDYPITINDTTFTRFVYCMSITTQTDSLPVENSSVELYLNHGILHIENESDVVIDLLEIFDMTGRCIRTIEYPTNELEISIPSAVYFVRITQLNKTIVKKVYVPTEN